MEALAALVGIQRELLCYLCNEPMRDPQTFANGCGHTFCRECVINTLEGPGIVKSQCPACKQPGWKKDLRTNYKYTAIAEAAAQLQGILQQDVLARLGVGYQDTFAAAAGTTAAPAGAVKPAAANSQATAAQLCHQDLAEDGAAETAEAGEGAAGRAGADVQLTNSAAHASQVEETASATAGQDDAQAASLQEPTEETAAGIVAEASDMQPVVGACTAAMRPDACLQNDVSADPLQCKQHSAELSQPQQMQQTAAEATNVAGGHLVDWEHRPQEGAALYEDQLQQERCIKQQISMWRQQQQEQCMLLDGDEQLPGSAYWEFQQLLTRMLDDASILQQQLGQHQQQQQHAAGTSVSLALPEMFEVALQQLLPPSGTLQQQLQHDLNRIDCCLAQLDEAVDMAGAAGAGSGAKLTNITHSKPGAMSVSHMMHDVTDDKDGDVLHHSVAAQQQQQQYEHLSTVAENCAAAHDNSHMDKSPLPGLDATKAAAVTAVTGRSGARRQHRLSQRSGRCVSGTAQRSGVQHAATAAASGVAAASRSGRSCRPSLDGAFNDAIALLHAESQQKDNADAAAAAAVQEQEQQCAPADGDGEQQHMDHIGAAEQQLLLEPKQQQQQIPAHTNKPPTLSEQLHQQQQQQAQEQEQQSLSPQELAYDTTTQQEQQHEQQDAQLPHEKADHQRQIMLQQRRSQRHSHRQQTQRQQQQGDTGTARQQPHQLGSLVSSQAEPAADRTAAATIAAAGSGRPRRSSRRAASSTAATASGGSVAAAGMGSGCGRQRRSSKQNKAAAAAEGDAARFDAAVLGIGLEGLHIEVYWSGDDEYYPAQVGKFNAKTKKFKIHYQDEEEENLALLAYSKWRFAETVSAAERQLQQQWLGARAAASASSGGCAEAVPTAAPTAGKRADLQLLHCTAVDQADGVQHLQGRQELQHSLNQLDSWGQPQLQQHEQHPNEQADKLQQLPTHSAVDPVAASRHAGSRQRQAKPSKQKQQRQQPVYMDSYLSDGSSSSSSLRGSDVTSGGEEDFRPSQEPVSSDEDDAAHAAGLQKFTLEADCESDREVAAAAAGAQGGFQATGRGKKAGRLKQLERQKQQQQCSNKRKQQQQLPWQRRQRQRLPAQQQQRRRQKQHYIIDSEGDDAVQNHDEAQPQQLQHCQQTGRFALKQRQQLQGQQQQWEQQRQAQIQQEQEAAWQALMAQQQQQQQDEASMSECCSSSGSDEDVDEEGHRDGSNLSDVQQRQHQQHEGAACQDVPSQQDKQQQLRCAAEQNGVDGDKQQQHKLQVTQQQHHHQADDSRHQLSAGSPAVLQQQQQLSPEQKHQHLQHDVNILHQQQHEPFPPLQTSRDASAAGTAEQQQQQQSGPASASPGAAIAASPAAAAASRAAVQSPCSNITPSSNSASPPALQAAAAAPSPLQGMLDVLFKHHSSAEVQDADVPDQHVASQHIVAGGNGSGDKCCDLLSGSDSSSSSSSSSSSDCGAESEGGEVATGEIHSDSNAAAAAQQRLQQQQQQQQGQLPTSATVAAASNSAAAAAVDEAADIVGRVFGQQIPTVRRGATDAVMQQDASSDAAAAAAHTTPTAVTAAAATGQHLAAALPVGNLTTTISSPASGVAPRLLLCGYSSSEMESLKNRLRAIGVEIVTKVDSKYTTCVVSAVDACGRSHHCNGTTMLKALLHGKPIMQHSWLADSLAAGRLMPITDAYLVQGFCTGTNTIVDGGPARSYAAAVAQQSFKLFAGLAVVALAQQPTEVTYMQVLAAMAKLGGAAYVVTGRVHSTTAAQQHHQQQDKQTRGHCEQVLLFDQPLLVGTDDQGYEKVLVLASSKVPEQVEAQLQCSWPGAKLVTSTYLIDCMYRYGVIDTAGYVFK